MVNQENTAANTNLNLGDYSTATSFDYCCPYKLPCGYCSYMNRPCVKTDYYSITWTANQASTNFKKEND